MIVYSYVNGSNKLTRLLRTIFSFKALKEFRIRNREFFSHYNKIKGKLVEDDYYVALQAAGFPDNSAGKVSTCNMGDLVSIPGLGRSSGEGNGCPLQYSGLENSMHCIVHEVAKSW